MKVLFAVNNESISESITQKYQQEYKEIISAKNVYYFNAIIKELQRDKTYDRIIISEDLQPFSNNNYEQIDKFIFDKMDNISDEATNQNGNDIPIILICADRREKSESLLVKLFGIGVYNALIGKDRSITAVCQLLNRPRGKKEAKVYYHIDPDDVDYKTESEGDVSEVEIQNIINHYKRLGKNEEQYVESFNHIANQYTDSQLRLIAKFLPLNVKAVLEANSQKYQEIVAFGMKSRPQESYNNYNSKKVKNKNKKEEIVNNIQDIDAIAESLNNNIITEPVIIPSTNNQVKKVPNILNENSTTVSNNQIETNIQKNTEFQNKVEQNKEIEEIEELEENIEEPQVKRRGRPRKVKIEETIEETPKMKRGRGRPKKVTIMPETVQEEIEEGNILPNFEETSNELPVNLFELEETEQQTTVNEQIENDVMLPGLDEEFLFTQEPEVEETQSAQSINNKYNIKQQNDETLFKETSVVTNNYNNYKNTEVASAISKEGKIVAFVGTSKNGTSFLVNNTAEILSQKGIDTAILDLTQNKNAYYIYTENDENLRKIASSCIENLKVGKAQGIEVHKNLTVYTTVPGEQDETKNIENILETVAQKHSLVILDCDFDTHYNYFANVQEIYLVQSLDILTIQPLTAFLRNLKAKNVLAPEKIRIALNKVVKLKSVTEKTIIGGIAYYNDPAMSFMTELFNKDTVKYCVVPFEEQTYAKYLDGIINCKISLNGYSKNLIEALKKLTDMVYPLIGNNIKNNQYRTAYNTKNNFSESMNNTLNKMKNNY